MILQEPELKKLHKLAVSAAEMAGKLIQSYSKQKFKVQHKNGGESEASQVVTEVDFQSEKLILEQLVPSCKEYDLAILTEETTDDKSRFEKDYSWCIDPLDGTLPFTERKPGYAVSIALISKSGSPIIGVVHDPVHSTSYSAMLGFGAFKNGRGWNLKNSPDQKTKLTFYYNRSFKKLQRFKLVLEELDKIAIKMNLNGVTHSAPAGAALNACRALENTPSCYFAFPKKEDGGGSLWDYSATACIYHELGVHVSDIHGAPLELNRKESTFLNHRGILYASNSLIAKEIIKLYKGLIH